MDISGKTILITGASSGIGAALARMMAKAGAARIHLLARNLENLETVARQIEENGGKASCHAVDLTDSAAIADTVRIITAKTGVPDILVNNAGSGQWKFLHETSPAEIERTMAMPYLAAAWLTQQLLPRMLVRGSGHIVNLSSVASRMAWPGATAYIAACRAMRGLSDALRADLHGTGIHITHYESGPVDSPYWRNNPGSRERVPGIARLLVPVLTEEQAAGAIFDGIQRERNFIVPSARLKLVYALHGLFPSLVQMLMTTTGYQPAKRPVRSEG